MQQYAATKDGEGLMECRYAVADRLLGVGDWGVFVQKFDFLVQGRWMKREGGAN